VATAINPARAGLYDLKRTSDAIGAAGTGVGAVAGGLASHVVSALAPASFGPPSEGGGSPAGRSRLWAGAAGTWEDAGARGGPSGYKYSSRGLTAGYDRLLGPLMLGASLSILDGGYEDKDARGHDSGISTRIFGIRAGFRHEGGPLLALMAAYARGDNDIREFDGPNWAAEDFSTTTWHVDGRAGFRWALAEGPPLTPTIGPACLRAKAEARDLDYAWVRLLSCGEASSGSARVPVEAGLDYRAGIGPGAALGLNLRAGWSRAFGNGAPEGSVTLAGMGNVPVLRGRGRVAGGGALNAGLGISLGLGNADFVLDYGFRAQEDHRAHSLALSFGPAF
jgi:outer membrane autotransporter protein